MDSWLLLQVVESGGERNRILSVIKSRGMAHSNQGCEFHLSAAGLELADTYLGARGVLTGSARLAQEAADAAELLTYEDEIERLQEERVCRRTLLKGQISALRAEFAVQDAALQRSINQDVKARERLLAGQKAMAKSRQAFQAKVTAGRDNKQDPS